MSVTDIRIPQSTLAELRGVLVRALSRENLSVTDKIAVRKSHSSNALKAHYVENCYEYQGYNGGKSQWVGQLDYVCEIVPYY
jgi:hypothetical protein